MTSLYRIDGWSDREWILSPAVQHGQMVRVERLDQSTWARIPRRLLVPHPNARTTDPSTSHAAAAMQTPERMRAVYRLVLALLYDNGPLNDFELARLATEQTGKRHQQTGIGKRRLELARMGYIIDSGTRAPSDSGAESIRWALTNAGRQAVAS